MSKKSQEYNNIEQLSSIEHIRLRPGMYIGSNETPSHLFSEVIDNALDEAANGFCDRIDIVYKDNIVSIKDNGRGIPHTKTNKGQEAIIAATENMSGGKFNRDNYKKSCGLHGVGLCAVRALSDFLTISSVRDKEEYKAEFVDAELKDFIKTKVNEKPGTFVQFKPDVKYFEHEEIPLDYIIERGKVAVTELPKLKIFFNDTEITPYTDEEIIGKSDIKFPIIKASDKQTNDVTIRLGYTSVGLQSNESGCVNLLPVNSGTHIDIAKKAIVDAWEQTGFIGDLELKPEDVLIGLQMWVSASFIETAWTSQDKKQLKMRLKNFDELIKSLSKVIVKTIQSLTKESRDTLLRKFVDYRESQNKLSTAKYMQGIVKYGDEGKTTKRSFSSDSKLVDCVSEDRDSTELFVCEGTSAGSNLISQRDPMIHAVLPLRGKPRNIMEESVETILNNLEMRSLVNALGTGLMKHERPELCRYGKIIIASDADCFTGDTKVYTCDGLEHTLEEACTNDLDLLVLSRDQNNKIVPAKAKSLKSRLVTELCLITLDNGESIKCTPDHRFMLKNGEYKCVCELTANDSLMPLATTIDVSTKEETYNHFVIKSEMIRLNEPVQMYDLIVPEYNNFALSAGVFVHNCDGLQISSLVLAALCYLVPNTVLSGRVHLMTAPLYGIINQNIIKFETDDLDRYYLIDDTAVVNNKEKSVKSIKVDDVITFDNKNYTVKSITKYSKDEFIPVWECYLSPTIKLKRYKGLGSMSPAEAKISLLSDKRKLQTITGTHIDKVMKLVGETEFKKLLMKQQDIIDWQC